MVCRSIFLPVLFMIYCSEPVRFHRRYWLNNFRTRLTYQFCHSLPWILIMTTQGPLILIFKNYIRRYWRLQYFIFYFYYLFFKYHNKYCILDILHTYTLIYLNFTCVYKYSQSNYNTNVINTNCMFKSHLKT